MAAEMIKIFSSTFKSIEALCGISGFSCVSLIAIFMNKESFNAFSFSILLGLSAGIIIFAILQAISIYRSSVKHNFLKMFQTINDYFEVANTGTYDPMYGIRLREEAQIAIKNIRKAGFAAPDNDASHWLTYSIRMIFIIRNGGVRAAKRESNQMTWTA